MLREIDLLLDQILSVISGNVMSAVFYCRKPDVTAGLTGNMITELDERLCQVIPGYITRQLHTARTSSWTNGVVGSG